MCVDDGRGQGLNSAGDREGNEEGEAIRKEIMMLGSATFQTIHARDGEPNGGFHHTI